MSEVKSAVLAAAGVVAAAAAIILGARHRERVDTGVTPTSLGSMLASNEKQVNVPASDYYRSLSEKLKREYVEPVDDDMKLASGAIRGMVGSLADPRSLYMDRVEFQNYLNARKGEYVGIGAEFALQLAGGTGKASKDYLQPTGGEDAGPASSPQAPASGMPQVPRLTVISVVPGGPADKAGVKPGDIVDSIDGHWVFNSSLLAGFRKAQKDYQNKKITLEQINKLKFDLWDKYEHALLPLRAKTRLTQGEAGTVKVVWERGGAKRTTSIDRAPSRVEPFQVEGDRIALRFVPENVAKLREAIKGKAAVTIDLRSNVNGDFRVMKECLSVVAPAGEYGTLANDRQKSGTPFRIASGNAKPPKMTILTDGATRGAAQIFALALSSKGLAKLSGNVMGEDRPVVEVVNLPDGSGYTLVTANYKPTLETKPAVKPGLSAANLPHTDDLNPLEQTNR